MRDATAFTDPDNWSGGFYELSLEIGERDDGRLQRALTALWRAAGLTGCYGNAEREPAEQSAVPLTVASLEEFGHLRGVVTLPSADPVVCGCIAIRLDGDNGDNQDWLTFYLPLGALGVVVPDVGGFPFGPDGGPRSLDWRVPLDAWLAEVAREVFRHLDFRLGLIGFDVDITDLTDPAAGVVPEQRWNGYLLPVGGKLEYVPANR